MKKTMLGIVMALAVSAENAAGWTWADLKDEFAQGNNAQTKQMIGDLKGKLDAGIAKTVVDFFISFAESEINKSGISAKNKTALSADIKGLQDVSKVLEDIIEMKAMDVIGRSIDKAMKVKHTLGCIDPKEKLLLKAAKYLMSLKASRKYEGKIKAFYRHLENDLLDPKLKNRIKVRRGKRKQVVVDADKDTAEEDAGVIRPDDRQSENADDEGKKSSDAGGEEKKESE
ncbi:MAG: hypothetical protein LBO73_03810 [Holosporaceae bacterium]|nr:hypothetical protein [Holosporaceae bacterium]